MQSSPSPPLRSIKRLPWRNLELPFAVAHVPLDPTQPQVHTGCHDDANVMETGMRERWEHFEHGADIGVRGIGTSKAAAFEQAALALTAVIADPAGVQPRERVRIACEAASDELLLVRWLNALIFEMAVRHLLFSRFEVEIDANRLHASALGEAVNVQRHRPAVEVKGATCTQLCVAQEPNGEWIAQTVVDV